MKAITALTWFMIFLLALRYLSVFFAINEIIPLLFLKQEKGEIITPGKKAMDRKVLGVRVELSYRLLIILIVAIGLALPIVWGGLYLLKLNQG